MKIEPKGPYAAGKSVPLEATASSEAVSWQWATSDVGSQSFTDIVGAVLNTYDLVVDKNVGRTLRATAQLKSGGAETGNIVVEMKPAVEQGGSADDGPAEPPAIWHAWFAVLTGVIAIVSLLAFVLLTSLGDTKLGLDATAYVKLDGRGLVGAAVIGPITIVGVAVTLIGVWMVVVEWRGRFSSGDAATPKGGLDVGSVVTALGKLKGATLVLLSGVAIVLSVAWMTSSTTGAEPSPTPTPSGTSTSSLASPSATAAP